MEAQSLVASSDDLCPVDASKNPSQGLFIFIVFVVNLLFIDDLQFFGNIYYFLKTYETVICNAIRIFIQFTTRES